MPHLQPDQFLPWLPDAVHLARARLGNRSAAEDAVQEACLDALRAAARFRGDLDQARAWFLTLVINRCRMAQRSLQRRDRHTAAAGDAMPTAIVDADHDLGEALRAALATLPEHEREVIELRFLAGLDFADIARVLDRREKTVRSQADRGLAHLREAVPRVGLTAGGTAALGVALAGLPRGTPSAELVEGVRHLQVPAATGGMAAASLINLALLTAVAIGTGWWFSRHALPAGPPAVQAADPPATSEPRHSIQRIGDGPFAATGPLRDVAFSPSGDHLAWWAEDGRAGIWTMPNGANRMLALLPGWIVKTGAWMDDRRLAVVARHEDATGKGKHLTELLIVDNAGRIQQRTMLPERTDPYTMARSEDGRWLAFPGGVPAGTAKSHPGSDDLPLPEGDRNTGILVVDGRTGALAERIGPFAEAEFKESVAEVAIEDSRVAALCRGDSRRNDPVFLVVWDRNHGAISRTLPLPRMGYGLQRPRWVKSKLELSAISTDDKPETWSIDPATGAMERTPGWDLGPGARHLAQEVPVPGQSPTPGSSCQFIRSIAINPRYLAVVRQSHYRPLLIETGSGRVLTPFGPSTPCPPDDLGWVGEHLAMRYGNRILATDGGSEPVAWIPDGSYSQGLLLAVGGDLLAVDREKVGLQLFDSRQKARIATLTPPPESWVAQRVAIAPNGSRLLVSWGNGPVQLLDPKKPAVPIAELVARWDGGLRAAWSMDASIVYLANDDNSRAELNGAWDAVHGKQIWSTATDDPQRFRLSDLVPIDADRVLARDGIHVFQQAVLDGIPFSSDEFLPLKDGRAQVLDAHHGTLLRIIADPGMDVVVTSDGQRAVGQRGVVGLADGALLKRWNAGQDTIVPSPGGGWIARVTGGNLIIEDTAGAGLSRCYLLRDDLPADPPTERNTGRVAWNAAEDRIAVSWPDCLPVFIVNPFAPCSLRDPVEARLLLDGIRWPEAVGCLAAAGDAGWKTVQGRAIDGQVVLLWELLAAQHLKPADDALRALAASAGNLSALARDALGRLAARTRTPGLPALPVYNRPPPGF